jgi:hypothetical protein
MSCHKQKPGVVKYKTCKLFDEHTIIVEAKIV